jgi:hypothetical protein
MTPRPLLRFGLGLALAAVASAATAPDWLKPYLAPEVLSWRKSDSARWLLDSREIRYTTADRATALYRIAMRLDHETYRDRIVASILYNPDNARITAVRAWIVSADGRKVRSVSRSDFVDMSAQYDNRVWDAQRRLVYSPAAEIEVGGVLAWEVQQELPPGIVDLSWSLPFSWSYHNVFEVTPPPGGKLEWLALHPRASTPTAGTAPGALRWETRQSFLGVVSWPAGYILSPLVLSVHCLPAGGGSARTWADVASQVTELFGATIEPTPEIRAKAEALVAGKTGRWERIRALTEFVQRDISYLAVNLDKDSLAGYRPHVAAAVLRSRLGDCKDKAALLVALLRALGEPAHAILCHAKNPKAILANWPSLSFNHAIVGLAAGDHAPEGWPTLDAGALGRLVVFDPTDSVTPLGALPTEDQAGYGLIVSREQAGLLPMPVASPEREGLDRRVHATLDAAGRLQATAEETRHGVSASRHWAARTALHGMRVERWVESHLHGTMPTVQVTRTTDTWEPASATYRIGFDFNTAAFARQMGGNLLLFVPHLVSAFGQYNEWRTGEQIGFSWLPAESLCDEVRIALPEGATVAELPAAWSSRLPTAGCSLSYRLEGRELIYRSEYTRQASFYDKASYEALRAFVQKVRDAQRRPVLLRTAPVSPAPAS